MPPVQPPSGSIVDVAMGDDESSSSADRPRFDALVEWMKSLPCTTAPLNDRTMRNCRAFAEVLHHIDSSFFSEDWVEKIQEYEIESNWRVKANNLRKVLRRVTEFYSEVLHRDVSQSARWKVDEQEFADVEHGDLSHMCTLIYLLIGAAFLNDATMNKFVGLLGMLSPHVQQAVMTACTEVKQNSQQIEVDPDSTQSSARSRVSNGSNGLDEATHGELEAKLDAKNKQISELEEEKRQMAAELEGAKQLLKKSEERDEQRHRDDKETRELREKKRLLEDQLIEVESERESHRTRNVELAAENMDMKEKLLTIRHFEEDYRAMKDEVEEGRVAKEECGRLHQQLEQMKNKLREASSVLAENKVLREKNDSYVQYAIEVEEEKRKNTALRTQMGAYKATCDEKESECQRLTLRCEKLECEAQCSKEKLASLEADKQRWTVEKAELNEMICAMHIKNGGLSAVEEERSLEQSMLADQSISPDTSILERVQRLEYENKALQDRARDLEELESLRVERDEARGEARQKETEARLERERREAVESKLSELEASMSSSSSGAHSEAATVRLALEKAKTECEQWREKARTGDSAHDTINRLHVLLKEKEDEIVATTEKMNDYLSKAKAVIIDQERSIHQQGEGGLSLHEFDSLRTDIKDKERRIKQLEQQLEKTATMNEQEQRLVTSSWYTMSQQLVNQQLVVGDSSSRSLLARERNAPAYSVSSGGRLASMVPWVLVVVAVLFAVLIKPVLLHTLFPAGQFV